eukprot:TRINITY_DN5051_c0_g1::TRINITY_DN5051_c0_g1_i1::g.24746::m.24746 TRINITY_DN5051_c0_g1::TRINITY_DN5051_c0_g1_i1::g.24746  ORF type:complete len:519 (-),score=60.38,sp/Q9M363/B561I_ARATH/27.92/1e-16,DOMON/PF03351.12/3.6e-11,Cytochrom_B561/PF03188.11/1.2e+04,Cytochrom_B561/PF03188.11/0.0013,DUF4231/PF14015.1/0.082 TRINITY_DN5051_c0_g1_i1:100-1656(-)
MRWVFPLCLLLSICWCSGSAEFSHPVHYHYENTFENQFGLAFFVDGNDVYWKYNCTSLGWCGIAFNVDKSYRMVGAEAWVAWVSDGLPHVSAYKLAGTTRDSMIRVDGKEISEADDSFQDVVGFEADAQTIIKFRRKLEFDENIYYNLSMTHQERFIWALGPNDDDTFVSIHSHHSPRGHWVSLSGRTAGQTRYTPPLAIAHGVVMSLGPGLCMPAAALIARYHKHSDRWLKMHTRLQVAGLSLLVVGVVLGLCLIDFRLGDVCGHGAFGLVILGLAAVQAGAALRRPGRGEKHRVGWEMTHKALGRALPVLVLANLILGIDAIGTESIFVVLIVVGYIGLVLVYVLMEECFSVFQPPPRHRHAFDILPDDASAAPCHVDDIDLVRTAPLHHSTHHTQHTPDGMDTLQNSALDDVMDGGDDTRYATPHTSHISHTAHYEQEAVYDSGGYEAGGYDTARPRGMFRREFTPVTSVLTHTPLAHHDSGLDWAAGIELQALPLPLPAHHEGTRQTNDELALV